MGMPIHTFGRCNSHFRKPNSQFGSHFLAGEMARYGEVLTDFAKPFLLLSRHSLAQPLCSSLSLVVAFLISHYRRTSAADHWLRSVNISAKYVVLRARYLRTQQLLLPSLLHHLPSPSSTGGRRIQGQTYEVSCDRDECTGTPHSLIPIVK